MITLLSFFLSLSWTVLLYQYSFNNFPLLSNNEEKYFFRTSTTTIRKNLFTSLKKPKGKQKKKRKNWKKLEKIRQTTESKIRRWWWRRISWKKYFILLTKPIHLNGGKTQKKNYSKENANGPTDGQTILKERRKI